MVRAGRRQSIRRKGAYASGRLRQNWSPAMVLQHSRNHAIVIGASMGGLLAARALADRFARVTLIERDAIAPEPVQRKGVPQGEHAHGLLARGREIIEEFFPGISAELESRGALRGEVS